jgi:hypothetical protein
MIPNDRKILACLLSIVLTGCAGKTLDSPDLSRRGGGAGGSAGSNGGGGGNGGDAGGDFGLTCMPGIPATTQIPRMKNQQYDAVVRDLLGLSTLTTAMNQKPSDLLAPDFDGPMPAAAWSSYQSAAATIAHEVMTRPNQSQFVACDPSASGCLTQTIETFGRRAFRRPLTTEEVARFEALGQTTPAGAPADVAETILTAFLVSPSFLLLPELAQTTDPSGAGIDLSSYEVATRLSFMLWGSIPDDALNAAADNNQLQTRAQILLQAQRMIQVQNKTGPLVSAFHDDWVQQNNTAQHWWRNDHDPTQYPLYNAANKSTYAVELDSFWQAVAYSGGQFNDLFLSNIAFVNSTTAPIYGLDASSYGTDLTQVQLDSNQRPGFMTRLGFLSSYSDYTATSPILRGAFIEVFMLGNNPGPPPAGSHQTPVPSPSFPTRRQEIDYLVRESTTCQTCHVTILDPPGFALENYNAIGQWQTVDPLGGPIDATATVLFSQTDTHEVTTPLELMQGIAQTPQTRATYVQDLVSYAYGRPPNLSDGCVVDELIAKSESGQTIVDLLADLTQPDSFRMRVRAIP